MIETVTISRMEADMIFLNTFLTATTGTGATAADPFDPTSNLLLTVIMIVVMLGAFYIFSIRPQRKRNKELKEMMSKMAVGDKIVTVGGVVGTIANIKEDEVTISTSVAYTMITFKRQSIETVIPREK